MPFKVTARTILQLGAELISSDAVAFYELIKNAFDAGSPRVEINVVNCIPHDSVTTIREVLAETELQLVNQEIPDNTITSLRELFQNEFERTAPNFDKLTASVKNAVSFKDFRKIIDESNNIEIKDTGEGMSHFDLINVYMTIGTRSRLEQREKLNADNLELNKSKRPILGEKGLGRLSTMRLGEQLRVSTSRSGESHWNMLEIDWRAFSHASNKLIEEIAVEPYIGSKKDSPEVSGTTIYISALESEWSRTKLEQIAREEFSRLTDPFVPSSRYPITLRFNGNIVPIVSFDKLLFESAHATVKAEFRFDDKESLPQLVGSVDYKYRHRQKTFELDGADLLSTSGANPFILRRLGSFKVELYWFNRRLFNRTEGGPDFKRLKDLVNQWAGGLMVYRDGFRVNPYGSPADDWLNLDKTALAAPGYKVNRRQVIGKVDITARGNPLLVDQTNREGLRDNDEKNALVKLLQYVLLNQLRAFLDEVDKDVQAREPLSFDDFEGRVQAQERQIEYYIQTLTVRHPAVAEETEIINQILGATDNIRALMTEANQLAEEYEKGRTELVHLAGLGLMVEIIGHELARATSHTLGTLESVKKNHLPDEVTSVFETLREQLKTIERRLRVLDPLSTSGRQIKEPFDLIAWVKEILKSHEAQFERHDIELKFLVEPIEYKNTLTIKAVKGMIVQILENLLSNSIYWIEQEKRLNPKLRPFISVLIDTKAKEIRFTDNGPGITPNRRKEIFQPFVTTKPPGQGKGLGLYVSNEVAKYNGAALYLSDEHTVHPNKLNTFVFALDAKDR
jgi:signal transduction histidine kinase